MISFKGRCAAATMAALLQGTAPLHAEMRPSLSFSGVPGLIDMPSGEAMPDGTISVAAALFGPQYRTTLTFQITPRISGSYRFSATRNWNDITAGTPDDDGYDTYNDRSFDLRFLVLKETDYLPSITLGLQDFVGTGLASAEYIAATKTFSDRFKVTAGLGWGTAWLLWRDRLALWRPSADRLWHGGQACRRSMVPRTGRALCRDRVAGERQLDRQGRVFLGCLS